MDHPLHSSFPYVDILHVCMEKKSFMKGIFVHTHLNKTRFVFERLLWNTSILSARDWWMPLYYNDCSLHPTNPFTFVLRDESVDGRYLPSNANWNVASSNWLCFFVSYVGSPSEMMEPCLLSELELQGWSLSMSFSNGDPQWGLSDACFLYGLHLSKLELPSNAHDKCLNRRSYSWWHDTCDSPNWD